MKSYWYIETKLKSALHEIIVSQLNDDNPSIAVYSHENEINQYFPAFQVEWWNHRGVWMKNDEEPIFTYLPDNIVVKAIELSYVEPCEDVYPPGFTEQMF